MRTTAPAAAASLLAALACCTGGAAAPDDTGESPAPTNHTVSQIWQHGEGGCLCIGIPALIHTRDQTILAFAECRMWKGDGCLPSTPAPPQPAGFNCSGTCIVAKRSADGKCSSSSSFRSPVNLLHRRKDVEHAAPRDARWRQRDARLRRRPGPRRAELRAGPRERSPLHPSLCRHLLDDRIHGLRGDPDGRGVVCAAADRPVPRRMGLAAWAWRGCTTPARLRPTRGAPGLRRLAGKSDLSRFTVRSSASLIQSIATSTTRARHATWLSG
eukprot:COSAG04_NODE_952_length_9209_cov_4.865093_7_plen_271_part_00